MDWEKTLYTENEKPLDRLVEGYSNTSIFRTIAFVGDSMSSGEFETRDENGNPGYHDMFEYSWGQFIARANGLKAYNFSRGGMTAMEYIESFAEANGFWNPEKAAQAYVIALGVNDVYGRHMEIGDVSDIESGKPTFVGYYGQIIKRYKEISPDAKFFCITVPCENRSEKNKAAEAVRNAICSLVEYFENSYVIDLYQYGPEYNAKFHENFFLLGHMSPTGYLLTAKLVDSYIDYIIRTNPEDFKHVGFIGSGIKY